MTPLFLLIDGGLIKVTDGAYVGWSHYVERVEAKHLC